MNLVLASANFAEHECELNIYKGIDPLACAVTAKPDMECHLHFWMFMGRADE
jgi:hypothetical protein